MKRLALVLTIAACSSSPEPPPEAESSFFSQFALIEMFQSQALQAQTPVAPLDTMSLDYTGPCSLGGTVHVTGSYNGDGSEQATYDITETLDHCAEDAAMLDGHWHWTSTFSGGTSAQIVIDADFTVVTSEQTSHVIYDLAMTLYMDGHLDVTGTIDIDGKKYTAVDWDF